MVKCKNEKNKLVARLVDEPQTRLAFRRSQWSQYSGTLLYMMLVDDCKEVSERVQSQKAQSAPS